MPRYRGEDDIGLIPELAVLCRSRAYIMGCGDLALSYMSNFFSMNVLSALCSSRTSPEFLSAKDDHNSRQLTILRRGRLNASESI